MARLYALPQDAETPVQVVCGAHWAYRWVYARSVETQLAGEPGQDYAMVYEGSRRLAFAVCDGVSQAFCGDLAARHLGTALVHWLTAGLPRTLDPARLHDALVSYLQLLVTPIARLVDQQPLPADMAPLLRDVLEQKRALGSDAMFAAGRIDLPGAAFPQGRLVLAWLGDVRLRVWGPDQERTAELGGAFRSADRWSSRRGIIGGGPHLFSRPLEEAGRRTVVTISAYSDGLPALTDQDQPPSIAELEQLIRAAQATPTSDDIVVFDLWLSSADHPARDPATGVDPSLQRITAPE